MKLYNMYALISGMPEVVARYYRNTYAMIHNIAYNTPATKHFLSIFTYAMKQIHYIGISLSGYTNHLTGHFGFEKITEAILV